MEFIAILIRGFFCLYLTDYDFLRNVNQNQSFFYGLVRLTLNEYDSILRS